MDYSLLISDIYRKVWAIEPRLALSYAPIIANLLEGNTTIVVEKEPLSICAISDNGDKFSQFSDAPSGSVAIIPLKGLMRKSGGPCSYGTEDIASVMDDATSANNIDAIILDTDSGGGSMDSISPMIESIKKAQTAGKPVIALCDLAASAAYYVASQCDCIIASNDISSEFGSIGVLANFMDMKPYYEKMGVKIHTVYAPESTHKNLPLENALKGEEDGGPDYSLLKTDVLSPPAKKFQEAVKKNRCDSLNMDTEGILNGKMFYAKDAIKAGLADKIGNMDLALRESRKLATAYQFNNQKK
jgi:protease IV